MPTNPYIKYFTVTKSNNTVKYRGPKPKNVESAFLISIAKWEFICSLEKISGIGTGYGDTCGLCMFSNECDDCPVFKETGMPNCMNTPYEDFIDADAKYEKALRKHAKRELAFLKKLYESHQNKRSKK